MTAAIRPHEGSYADRLVAVADRLRRLSPSWQNPERFHEAKSELVAELRRLAREQPAPTVRRVVVQVPVETVVERVVERVVHVPPPRRPRRRAAAPHPVLPGLSIEGTA